MNFLRVRQLWFELLKSVKAEYGVEHKGEKGTIRIVLHKVEVNQNRFLLDFEQGDVKHKNILLVIINKDRADIGSKWIRENYGESLKFTKDKSCNSSVPMKSNENLNSASKVEEFMKI